jgi:hypothetical protein
MHSLTLAILLLISPIVAHASPVGNILPGAEQRGEATFRFFGIPMYKARLYTDGGRAFDWQQDFAVELTYQRNLTEYDLVESTLREMKRLGQNLPVGDQLARCFDDVAPGDSYLAVTDGSDRIGLWRNGRSACTLSHPKIKRHFMSIFLGENSRSAKFTRKLRGL